MPNYVSVAQFAKNKETDRQTIYRLINDGKINTEDIAGRKVINWDAYRDVDIKSIGKEKEDIEKLRKDNIQMKNRINKLEQVVFNKSTTGKRGPGVKDSITPKKKKAKR